jgi:hypothetical protein
MQCPTLPPADIMLAADERAAGRAGLEIVDEAPRIVLGAAWATSWRAWLRRSRMPPARSVAWDPPVARLLGGSRVGAPPLRGGAAIVRNGSGLTEPRAARFFQRRQRATIHMLVRALATTVPWGRCAPRPGTPQFTTRSGNTAGDGMRTRGVDSSRTRAPAGMSRNGHGTHVKCPPGASTRSSSLHAPRQHADTTR